MEREEERDVGSPMRHGRGDAVETEACAHTLRGDGLSVRLEMVSDMRPLSVRATSR